MDELAGTARPEEMGDIELGVGRRAPDPALQGGGILLGQHAP
jgi:hypothetical protein